VTAGVHKLISGEKVRLLEDGKQWTFGGPSFRHGCRNDGVLGL